MSPTDSLTQLLRVDPRTGKFLLACIGVFAAAAIVMGFATNVSDLAPIALYLLGFGVVAVVLAFIVTNPAMRAVLCWIVIFGFGAWVIGLVSSAFALTPRLPPLPCYIRMPVELPDLCVARFSREVVVIGGDSAALRLFGPERLWLAQDTTAPPDTSVYLQFADPVGRDDTIALAQALLLQGWGVQGAELGGEMVKAGPGQNEVRFFHPSDQATAVALAQSLNLLTPGVPVHVQDFTRLSGLAPEGQLEIWLAATQAIPGVDG